MAEGRPGGNARRARRGRAAGRRRPRPLERRDRRTARRRRGPRAQGPRRGARRRGRGVGAGLVRDPLRRPGARHLGPGGRGDLHRGRDPRRDHALRHRGRRVRPRRAAGAAHDRRAGGLRCAHDRGRSARRWPAPRAPAATTSARRPRWSPSRWRASPSATSPREGLCKRLPQRPPARLPSSVVLKLVLPKGSLERATLELFEAADLTVRRSSSVEYKATIADPRVDEVRILRPQEIPQYVAEGLFDLGIAGRDWVEETESRRRDPRRARVLEGVGQPVPHRGGGARGLAVGQGRGPARRRAGVDRVPAARPGGSSPSAGCEADVRLSLRRHRGEGARHRRLRGRRHRDRPGPAGRRAEDHRRDPAQLHRASSPTPRPTPTRPSGTPWSSSRRCSTGCSRPGARCS